MTGEHSAMGRLRNTAMCAMLAASLVDVSGAADGLDEIAPSGGEIVTGGGGWWEVTVPEGWHWLSLVLGDGAQLMIKSGDSPNNPDVLCQQFEDAGLAEQTQAQINASMMQEAKLRSEERSKIGDAAVRSVVFALATDFNGITVLVSLWPETSSAGTSLRGEALMQTPTLTTGMQCSLPGAKGTGVSSNANITALAAMLRSFRRR